MPEFTVDQFHGWTLIAFRSNWTIRDAITELLKNHPDGLKAERAIEAYHAWISGVAQK